MILIGDPRYVVNQTYNVGNANNNGVRAMLPRPLLSTIPPYPGTYLLVTSYSLVSEISPANSMRSVFGRTAMMETHFVSGGGISKCTIAILKNISTTQWLLLMGDCVVKFVLLKWACGMCQLRNAHRRYRRVEGAEKRRFPFSLTRPLSIYT